LLVTEKPEGCTTVFLGGVSDGVTDDNVRELFQDCGEIAHIRWLMNKETNEFRG
jgi:nucleolin